MCWDRTRFRRAERIGEWWKADTQVGRSQRLSPTAIP
jgi:hypothetical protein